MGIDLKNASGMEFGCSGTRWQVYRSVAESFGWEPAGTLAPEGKEQSWSGSYGATAMQLVSAADAAALGLALAKAVQSAEFVSVLEAAWGGAWSDAAAWAIQIEDDRESISQLTLFCSHGAFRIS